MERVPVLDLSQDDISLAQQVRKACSQVGFFYVTNHGIDQSLVDEEFTSNCQLFSLPMEKKMQLLADDNNRGYTPFKEETLDPENQTVGDTKEGFYFGREVCRDSNEGALPLHGPNQWPSEQWVPGFRSVTMRYLEAMTQLGMRLLRLLALSLDLPGDFFLPLFDPPMIFLRPLHYEASVSLPEDGVFAAGAHTDYGMLTILATDEVPGLQIYQGEQWVDVPYIKGAFVINLGDMLERWTNGMYTSTLHRVVNTTGRERYSIPFFFEPNFNARVECLPQCCGPENPPRYPPTTAGQHLLEKYAATHSGYAGYTGDGKT